MEDVLGMNNRKVVLGFAAAATGAGMSAFGSPAAHAQIMPGGLLGTTSISDPMGGGSGRRQSIAAAIFPLAPWRFDFKGGGSGTIDGTLFAVESTFVNESGTGGYGIGGWYWGSRDKNITGDVYELHGKYFFNQKLGIQAGYVGFQDGGSGYDLYLTGNIAAKSSAETGKGGYSVDLGAGPYKDPGGTFASAFLAGSADVAKQVSVNASIWYVGDSSFTAMRYGLGLGYRF